MSRLSKIDSVLLVSLGTLLSGPAAGGIPPFVPSKISIRRDGEDISVVCPICNGKGVLLCPICRECGGDGGEAECPDCPVCEGRGEMSWEKAGEVLRALAWLVSREER